MQTARSNDGFTLIEALVSCTIFTIMSVGTMSMLLMSITTARANAFDSHAVALAVQEKEDIRSLDYTVVAGLTTRDPYTAAAPNWFPPAAPGCTQNCGTAFTVHSDISVNQPAASMSTIVTTVSWTYKGIPRTYVLRSIYANING